MRLILPRAIRGPGIRTPAIPAVLIPTLLILALLILVLLGLAGLAGLGPEGIDPAAIMRWAVAEQRGFQNQMAGAIRGLRGGEAGAWTALLGAAGAYGFVHALGPGHGKVAIGGVGLGSGLGARRLLAVALASSLAQALWAILLVYGGFLVFEVSADRLTGLARDVLAPMSLLAIGAIGALLIWRGSRAAQRAVRPPAGGHAPGCGCGGHGPAHADVARLSSWREGIALVLGIAVRPCTGAVFLLVIAWQMDLHWAGVGAVIAMGLGTALLTGLVAVSTVAARGLAIVSDGRAGHLRLVAPVLQITAGLLILWGSVSLI